VYLVARYKARHPDAVNAIAENRTAPDANARHRFPWFRVFRKPGDGAVGR
jgi:hypothetical protein